MDNSSVSQTHSVESTQRMNTSANAKILSPPNKFDITQQIVLNTCFAAQSRPVLATHGGTI